MSGPVHTAGIELGLRANWRQFGLLLVVNAFVGRMVGLERTVLPFLAETEFGIASKSVALSFIATFGVVKAATNLFAGRLGDLYGRKLRSRSAGLTRIFGAVDTPDPITRLNARSSPPLCPNK